MSQFVRWAQKEHRPASRIAASLLAGVLFVVALPLVVVRWGPMLDELLRLRSFHIGAVNYPIGGMLIAAGMFFAPWLIFVQLTRGRGTPLPMMPTQMLLTRGPFRYCRKPMSLGTILADLRLAVAAGTIAGMCIVLCLSGLLILYLKRIEEGELTERFGKGYLAYRRSVPFILPRIPERR